MLIIIIIWLNFEGRVSLGILINIHTDFLLHYEPTLIKIRYTVTRLIRLSYDQLLTNVSFMNNTFHACIKHFFENSLNLLVSKVSELDHSFDYVHTKNNNFRPGSRPRPVSSVHGVFLYHVKGKQFQHPAIYVSMSDQIIQAFNTYHKSHDKTDEIFRTSRKIWTNKKLRPFHQSLRLLLKCEQLSKYSTLVCSVHLFSQWIRGLFVYGSMNLWSHEIAFMK